MYIVLERKTKPGCYYPDSRLLPDDLGGDYVADLQQAQYFAVTCKNGKLETQPAMPTSEYWRPRQVDLRLL